MYCSKVLHTVIRSNDVDGDAFVLASGDSDDDDKLFYLLELC